MQILSKKIWFYLLPILVVLQNSLWADPVSLINDDGANISLKFNLPGYSLEKVNVDGEIYTQIKSAGSVANLDNGEPELPFFTQSIAIPGNSAVKLTVTDVQYDEVAIGKIISSKGAILRSVDPSTVPYTFNATYSQDKWLNETAANMGTPYIFRDVRGAVVTFKPFAYNPAKGVLKVAKSISVSIESVSGTAINALTRSRNSISKSFEELYSNHFLNYSTVKSRYDVIDDGEKMIILCASDYKSQMADFVEWKNQKGIETTLYTYPSETGGSGSSAVKAFIKSKYESDGITYALLVGDAEDIPSISASGGLSDPSYTKVDGSDHYPDIFVGRFSVNSTTYASNMVDKALHYEKEPLIGGSWYTKGIGQASNEGSPADYVWVGDMKDVMTAATYTEVDEIYQGISGSISQIQSALGDGRGWYNYMGHGHQTGFGFSGSSVSNSTWNSTAEYKNPVMISVACNNGEFDYGNDCIGEYATKISKKGAIVYLGSYISQPWTPPQHGQKEMVRLLTSDTHISVGGIIYNGGSKTLDAGNSSGQYLTTFDTWTLFGDPSLMVINDVPENLSVTGVPSNIGSGSQTININYGESIDGRVCVYSASNGILASKMLSNSSSSALSVNITDEDEVILTVTGRNKAPFIETISVQSGPSISVSTPNGGEKINTNTTYTITWEDNITENVKIELYKGGSAVSTLADDVTSDGSFSWSVNESLADGNDYKIRISGGGAEDMSDANFTIGADVADKYTLTVNKGSGDGEYTEGSTIEIVADDAPEGEIFAEWTGDIDNIDNVNSSTANIIIPGKDISVTATYKIKPSDNLIFIASWESNSDDLSSVDLDTTKIFSDTLLTASFDVGKGNVAEKIYPWANISGYLDTCLEGVTEIELKYKSDKPMLVILDQEGLSANGDSYQAKIDASSSWKTITLKVNETIFQQPTWKTTTASLDLSKVFSISFQPEIDIAGGSANFELESGFLYGYIGDPVPNSIVSVAKSSVAGLNLISSSHIGFTVKNAGNYNVKIYSLDGRTLFNTSGQYSNGSHKINWNGQNISKGIYLVSLEGMNTKFVRKAVFR